MKTAALLCACWAAVAAASARNLADLPLRFERAGAGFVARQGALTWTVSATGSRLASGKAEIRTRLAGARAGSAAEPGAPLAGQVNYLLGGPGDWRRAVPGYASVRYRGVYPGIDVVYHGRGGALEYDFVVAPGADPGTICLEFRGHQELRLDAAGALVIASAAGEIRWQRPHVYQGRNEIVAGRFVLAGRDAVTFALGDYDRSRELIIDPSLTRASYLGGAANEGARAIGRDAAGNIYLAGNTTSEDLPATAGVVQRAFGGMSANYATGDIFVAKFNPAGVLQYLTYIGGSGDEGPAGMAVDDAGNVYLTGATTSTNFPRVNALQPTFGGLGGNSLKRLGDAFILKLAPDGSRLLYSTFLGGDQDDSGNAIAVDRAGNAYVAGGTLSRNFPVTDGVLQRTYRGSGGQATRPGGAFNITLGDAFIAKLDANGRLSYATYLGGFGDDVPLAIAVDSAGSAYVGGYTLSADFPTTAGALKRTYGGAESQSPYFNTGDGFLLKLNPAASALVYSTFFCGAGDDAITALALDAANNVYFTGFSSSRNLPVTAGALQRNYGGYLQLPFLIEYLFGDAVVGKLNPEGSALSYLTYLGGAQNDAGLGIAVDTAGNAWVTGFSESEDFLVAGDPVQRTFAGAGLGVEAFLFAGDAFLAVVNPTGTALLYSSYYGGRLDDMGLGIAIDNRGNAFVAGMTVSPNLPVSAGNPPYRGAASSTNYIRGDAFYAVFNVLTITVPTPRLAAITNGASNATGAVAPGMVFVAYGANLGPSALAGAQLAADGRLASAVSDSQILFDGVPAPVVYTSAGQFSGIVPYSVSSKTAVEAVAVYQGQRSAPLTVNIAPSAPGLFSLNFTGSGQAAAFNQDGTLNSETNPAAKGSIVVFYGTGEGAMTPEIRDGSVAPGLPPWRPIQPLSMTVGGAPATIVYGNTAPSSVAGLLQVNAQLSPDTPSGRQPVVLRAGSGQSQPDLTIWVR
jgi:uncharacterized protein (TIGR03437 family)